MLLCLGMAWHGTAYLQCVYCFLGQYCLTAQRQEIIACCLQSGHALIMHLGCDPQYTFHCLNVELLVPCEGEGEGEGGKGEGEGEGG